jgi:predicted transcriptional regulator
MSKVTYQPIVIEKTNVIIDELIYSNFFKDNEIMDIGFAMKTISDILTEKFINGELENEELFTTDEFVAMLQMIIAENVLRELQKKGLITSYEDENTEEVFFLTELGKQVKDIEAMQENETISGKTN